MPISKEFQNANRLLKSVHRVEKNLLYPVLNTPIHQINMLPQINYSSIYLYKQIYKQYLANIFKNHSIKSLTHLYTFNKNGCHNLSFVKLQIP